MLISFQFCVECKKPQPREMFRSRDIRGQVGEIVKKVAVTREFRWLLFNARRVVMYTQLLFPWIPKAPFLLKINTCMYFYWQTRSVDIIVAYLCYCVADKTSSAAHVITHLMSHPKECRHYACIWYLFIDTCKNYASKNTDTVFTPIQCTLEISSSRFLILDAQRGGGNLKLHILYVVF